MKYIKILGYFFLWLLYVLITMNARTRYSAGLTKGCHCYKMDTYMNSTVYHFNRSIPPTREYITWKEFWKQRGY